MEHSYQYPALSSPNSPPSQEDQPVPNKASSPHYKYKPERSYVINPPQTRPIAPHSPSTHHLDASRQPSKDDLQHPQSQPRSDSVAASSSSSSRKKTVDRNRKPCTACSGSKRKCTFISTSPLLCERCHNHGLTACPPHTPWSVRRPDAPLMGETAPMGAYELYPPEMYSQLESDTLVVPRTRSPSYSSSSVSSPMSSFDSPDPDPSTTGQPLLPTTNVPNILLSDQSLTSSPPIPQMSGSQQPQFASWTADASLVQPPQLPQLNSLTLNNLQLLLPYLPTCHACNTPYDIERLHYALNLLATALSTPMSTGDSQSSAAHNECGPMLQQPHLHPRIHPHQALNPDDFAPHPDPDLVHGQAAQAHEPGNHLSPEAAFMWGAGVGFQN